MSDEKQKAVSYLVEKLETTIAEQREAAQCLDQCLLRCFDAGMLDVAIDNGCCGIDTWGSLKDFREVFKLPPTMSAEEWANQMSDDLAADPTCT